MFTAGKERKRGDENPPSEPSKSPVSSEEIPKCGICCGPNLVNPCRTNSCCHLFCYVCLLEWSNRKPECPSCRKPFDRIFYDIRVVEEFKVYRVPSRIASVENRGYQNRRRRYDRNEWVQPFSEFSSIQQSSLEFLETHPAAVNRVRVWLKRELTVLLGLRLRRIDMSFVYEVFVHCVVRMNVSSESFVELTRRFLDKRASHFLHELYHFIISGLSLEEYDRIAVYSSANGNISGATNPPPNPPMVITLDSDDE